MMVVMMTGMRIDDTRTTHPDADLLEYSEMRLMLMLMLMLMMMMMMMMMK